MHCNNGCGLKCGRNVIRRMMPCGWNCNRFDSLGNRLLSPTDLRLDLRCLIGPPPSSIFSGPSVHRLPMWLHKDCGLRSAAKKRERCVEGTEFNTWHLNCMHMVLRFVTCEGVYGLWSYWFWWKCDPVTIGERNCRRSHPGSINYGSFVLRLSLGLHKDCRLRFDCLHRANVMYVKWYSWHKAGTYLKHGIRDCVRIGI